MDQKIVRRSRAWLAIAMAGVLAAAAGCGGDGGGTGGTTGTGGTGTGGTGTGGTGGTGTGGTGTGGTGTGGTGGGAAACVDASLFASLFAIADSSFCAVAVYEADEAIGFQLPTWGTHGGPLTFQPDATGGGVTIERWKAPMGASGMLTKQTTHVDTMIPMGAYAGATATDLPFFGWTAISWTGAFPDTAGQVVMIKGAAVDHTYPVNGVYGLAGVGDATSGRLLFTGLSPLGTSTMQESAFYAADACDMPKPDLGAGTGCQPSGKIAAWGDSSGPVAVDHDGNAFALLTSTGSGMQEAHGFAAAEVARGAPATPGATLFDLPGFGSSLAAITPKAGKPGLLVFQPFDGTTYAPLDVIAQPYTASDKVAAQGMPEKLLTVPAAATAGLFLMTDDADRLWVTASGDKTTTFVVLARKP